MGAISHEAIVMPPPQPMPIFAGTTIFSIALRPIRCRHTPRNAQMEQRSLPEMLRSLATVALSIRRAFGATGSSISDMLFADITLLLHSKTESSLGPVVSAGPLPQYSAGSHRGL